MKTLKSKLETKIRRSRKSVFLRRDFKKLGGYDQVGRALSELIAEKKLLKLGYGLYAKARINQITGAVMLSSKNGFQGAAMEVLNRLKVNWDINPAQKAYDEGRTTQVPINSWVIISDRFSRKIGTDRYKLQVSKR